MLVTGLFISMLSGCDVSETTKTVTSTVIGTTVEATKGVSDGVKSGIEEGRKGATSSDGSTVLSEPDEIYAVSKITVLEAKASGDNAELVISFENTGDAPVHLIGLGKEGGALLIDADGFSTQLTSSSMGQLGEAIKVPPRAKVKESLFFIGDAAKAKAIRLWGQDIPVPGATAPVGTAGSTP